MIFAISFLQFGSSCWIAKSRKSGYEVPKLGSIVKKTSGWVEEEAGGDEGLEWWELVYPLASDRGIIPSMR